LRIERLEVWRERLPLTKPYTISRETYNDVELFFVRLHTAHAIGAGSASPAVEVTGESPERCAEALGEAAALLEGRDAGAIDEATSRLDERLPDAPAARAACDMALWDVAGKRRGLPVVDLLGRRHDALPTSVTVGIQSVDDAVASARDYLAQGFRALKVKLGRDVEEDVERLRRIRAAVGPAVAIRTDPNAGYDRAELERYLAGTRDLGIEFCEQPLPRGADADLFALPAAERVHLAADESVHDLADARDLIARRAYGIFNLKLMKCGGIAAAREIAAVADTAGIDLMWGCNDESRVSIAAALHAAFASTATRYLDLDGSFDLARDAVGGGFVLDGGVLRTVGSGGLGVEWLI
jgi:L-alanine-DL-glutamate epimerase-like enolase superfamily enzyme